MKFAGLQKPCNITWMKKFSSEHSYKDEYNETSVASDKNKRCQPKGTYRKLVCPCQQDKMYQTATTTGRLLPSGRRRTRESLAKEELNLTGPVSCPVAVMSWKERCA